MPFIPRYSITTNGALTFTGNTLGLSQLINVNQAGTQGSIGAFISLSGSQVPTFPIGTTLNYLDNSSQAILTIPPGSTILYAELIWGGNYLTRDQNISGLLNDSITFTTPLGNNTIIPDPATANQPTTVVSVNTLGFYMRSAEVTSLVQAAGSGTYSAGSIPGLVDPSVVSGNDTNHAGWTLAVVYGNPSLPARDLVLFVGAEIIRLGTSTDISLSGFETPVAGTVNGRILLSAQEGDANNGGDQALFGPTVGTLGILSGPNNPATNFFGSQINNDSGNLDTTGTFGTRNQNPFTLTNTVAGRQGWDITNVDASPFLTNAQTDAVLRLSSTSDLYMPNTIGIQIDVNAPNLQPVKSVDKAFAAVGDTLTYTVVIPNNGQADATNVIFTDTEPPDTTFVPGSFTLNGAPVLGADPNVGVNIGTIPAGGSATVTFQVLIEALPTPNPIVNQAAMNYEYQSSVGGPILSGSAISNQVTTQVNVAELTMVKSVDQAFATLGDTLTYTTVITNTGDVLASNIFFEDIPPAGSLFVPNSVTVNAVAQPGVDPSVGFNIGDLAAGATVTVTFQVIVNSLPVPAQLINTATATFQYQIDPGQPPVTETASSNPVSTQVNVASVSVVKSVDQATAITGDILTYTTVITNNGNIPLLNVIFTDTPPTGSSFVPGSVTLNGLPQPLADPSPPGFSIGDIAAGAMATVTFQALVTVVPVPPTLPELINTSTIDYQYQIDPNLPPLNGTMTSNPVITEVILGELGVVKSVDQAFATVGDTLTYTSVITNQGNVEASNIFFLDAPPVGTAFIPGSVTINGVPQAGLDPAAGFSIPASPPNDVLAPGGVVTVAFQVTISVLPVPPLLTNQSLVNYQFGVSPIIVTAPSNPVTTQVNVALINVVKSVDQATAITGDILTYTTVITNDGNIPLLNVIFTDTPPTGTSFVPGSVTVNGVSQPLANPTPPGFSIGDIAVGATVTVTFQVTVTVVPVPPALPVLTNTSTIDYQYQIDPNLPPLNGTMTSNPVVTEVILGELGVDKSVDQVFATVGDTLTYTSVITNQGNVEANNIFFLDVPPAGTAFVPGSVTINGVPQAGLDPAAGFSIPAGPPNDVLPPGGEVTVTFQVTISALPVPPQITNNSLVEYQFGEPPVIVTAVSNPVTTQVNAALVNVVKSVDKVTAITGEILTYTTVINNTGNVPLLNIIFTDTPPVGTNFVSGSVTVNGVSQPLVSPIPPGFSIGDIPAGATATVTFQVLVTVVPVPPAIPVLTNTSTIDYQYQIDPNLPPLNGTLTSNPVVTEVLLGELTVVKSVDQAFATVGDTLTYTSVITNQGNVEAGNIFFLDVVPVGTAFIPGSVTINGVPQAGLDPTLGFSIPAAPPNDVLPPGGVVTVAFQVTISALPVPPLLTNDSIVNYQFGVSPIIVTALSNPVTTQVNTASVTVVKSVDQATAITGDILTYTTVISNTGNIPLLNVIFTDTPPVGTSFVSGSVTVNGIPQLLANPIPPGFIIGNIPAGATATVTFQVTVTVVPTPPVFPVLTNTSTIDYQYQIDPNLPPLNGTNTSNPVVTLVTEGIVGELEVVKSVDQAFATVGDTLTYTSVITNQGNVEAGNIFFIDVPPVGTAFSLGTVTINGVPQAGLNPTVGFSIPAAPPNDVLPPGGVVTVAFQVTIAALPVPPQITNNSLVEYQFGDPPVIVTAESNPVTTQVNVEQVNVIKSVDKATAITGDILTYTTVISNTGNIPLLNVIFTDTPPAGTSFVPGSVTVNGVSQPLANPIPPGFSIGDIAVGATATVTFQVLVTVVSVPPALPVLSNTSTIDYQYQIDPNLPPLNGTATSNPAVTEVIAGELGVVKSVDQAFATVGDTLTYSVVITNQGNVEASNIFFLDVPSTGAVFSPGTVTINGVPQAGLNPTLGFSIPAAPPNDVLPPGGVVTVTFQVTIAALPVPPQIRNNALVEYQFGEPPVIVTAASNTVTTQVNAASVDVVKSVDRLTAITGDILTYTTVITNTGNIPLLNVIFTDTPPVGTSFVPGSVTVNGVSQPLVNPIPPGFSIGDIPIGGAVTVIFQVTVTVMPVPPVLPVLTNTAIIDYQYQIDPNLPPLNGTMTSNPVSTRVILGELGIVKSVDQAFATVGDTLTYTTVITNQGNVEASNIFFLDAPPVGTAFIPGTVTINGVPQAGLNPTLGFSIPANPPNDVLAPGGVVTVTFQATISSLPVPPQITNNALVNYQFGTPPVIVSAASNPVTTQVNVAQVNVVKSVDKATAITGDLLTYTTVISNTGNVPLLNVIFTDTPPAGTSFVPGSVTVNGVPQLPANPIPPGFIIGNIPAGATATVTFQVTVTVVPVPPVLPVLSNTSTIDYQYQIDPNLPPLNGTVTSNPAVTEVIAGELGIVKSVDQAFATLGDTLTYTIVITNQGNVEASNIFFLDVPSAGAVFIPGTVTINGVPQAGLNPTVGFSIPASPPNDVLAPGGVVTVTFQVTISALPVPPQIRNNALIDYQFGEPPVIVSAVSNTVTTQVNAASVNVVKSVDKLTAITGDILTYTTVITNTGNIPLSNVIFTDTPPVGTSFVPGSVTVNGISRPLANPIPPGFSIGDIAAGAMATVTFQVTVTVVPVPPALPVLTNTSTIDYQYQIDPNLPPLNGTATGNPVTTEVLLGELGVVKSVDKAVAIVGDTLTYTSVVTNQGNAEANNVFFRDAPPVGTVFSPGTVTINGVPQPGLNPTVGFSIPASPPNDVIPPGGVVTVTFQVTIGTLSVPAQITNNSSVNYRFGEPPIIVTASSNLVTTLVNPGELTIVESVDKAFAIVGDILTYTAVITNQGVILARSVFFRDVPPAGTVFIPGTVTINGAPQPALNPTAGFSIPGGPPNDEIPPGGVVTVMFQVRLAVLPDPPQLINQATVNFRIGDSPVVISADSNLVTTQVIIGELEVAKSVDKASATLGDILTYTMVVTNTRNVTSNDVFLTDAPPAGTDFVPGSVTIGGLVQPSLNPAIGFNLGSILPGSSVIVSFEVQIASGLAPFSIINQAQVTFNYRIDPSGPPVQGSATSNPVQTNVNEIMESVCIVAQKVYFSCQQRECFPTFTVELPTTGGSFTFVSIEFGNGVIVGSPIFTPIPSRPNFSRAQFTVRIPYVLVLKNALNESVQLSGDLPDIQKDIVVYLPPSRSELELSLLVETRTQLLTNPTFSDASVELAIGSFIITKITGIVQLLIPAFGFCPEPSPCDEFVPDDQNSCLIFTDPTLTPFPNNFFPPQLDTTSCMI